METGRGGGGGWALRGQSGQPSRVVTVSLIISVVADNYNEHRFFNFSSDNGMNRYTFYIKYIESILDLPIYKRLRISRKM